MSKCCNWRSIHTTFFYLIVQYIIEQLTVIISAEISLLIYFKFDVFSMFKDQTYLDFRFYKDYIAKMIDQLNKSSSNQSGSSREARGYTSGQGKWDRFNPT